MLMKIGEVTNKFGISHRSLHYWESVGIIESSREENDYRYYNGQNLQRIKQIVLLRKLRLSIPSIQEIFSSRELSKVIAVFTDHLDECIKEKDLLNALGVVLQQLIHMLKDKQNIESVYNYLDRTHSTESDEIKSALQTVFAEPIKEIAAETPQKPSLDLTGCDLSLEPMSVADIDEVTEVVRRCYENTEELDELLGFFDFESQLDMPDCTRYYKIMQNGQCIGAVNVAYSGRESMIIRNIAYKEADFNVYVFALLKQKHPDILCWMVFLTAGKDNRYCYHDCEMKKQQFLEDNGFAFYTNANDRHQYIKMMKPHDEVYNSNRYRFAILDGSMNELCHRFSIYSSWDFYDGMLYKCRFTDIYFAEALIYATGMERSRFYSSYMGDCDFRYTNLERSKFKSVNLTNCELENCDLTGMTVDGINVEEALEYYRNKNEDCPK